MVSPSSLLAPLLPHLRTRKARTARGARQRWRVARLPLYLERLEDRLAPSVSWTGLGDGTS
jgi:hypothetical protein